MKIAVASILGCLAILFSATTWADCSTGSCGGSECDYNQTSCQCTDPICNKPWYSDCISRGYCCEAFGNIGAR